MDQSGKQYFFAGMGASGLYIVGLNLRHAFALRGRADVLLGQAPPQNQLRLGDIYVGARGYERDEGRGNERLLGTLEYRHVIGAAGRLDLFGLLTVTRLEGAVFADALYMRVDQPGCRQRGFYDVGYSLRFVYDALGVSPMSLTVDAGIPLRRCPGERHRLPLTVWVSVGQSLLVF